MRESEAPSLRERKHQVVREAIRDAAIDLFAGKGFDETTVEDIALKAGVSRRTLFRYFSSKNDLMAQGALDYGTELIRAIESCPKDWPLPEVFQTTVLQIARQSAGHPRTRKIMEIAAKYPEARAAQIAHMAEVQDRVASAFGRRRRKGSEDDLTPGILAGLTLSVLAVTFRAWFRQGSPEIGKIAEEVLATTRRLIAAKPAT